MSECVVEKTPTGSNCGEGKEKAELSRVLKAPALVGTLRLEGRDCSCFNNEAHRRKGYWIKLRSPLVSQTLNTFP